MRQIVDFLGEAGAVRVRIENGGRHPRIVFGWQGQDRSYVVSGTPSDNWAAARNSIRDIRHMLGLVEPEKRVGERRPRRQPRRSQHAIIMPPEFAAIPDWRENLTGHPAVIATLPARLDAAWWALWRELHGPRYVLPSLSAMTDPRYAKHRLPLFEGERT